MIQSKGGRFVRMKDNVWSVIPAKACRLKVAHAIQYHIRNELSPGKDASSIPTDVIINSRPGPEEQLSVNQLIVEDIKAKISWLQMQQSSCDLEQPYPGARNHVQSYNTSYRQSELSNVDNVRSQHEKEASSSIPYHALYPFVEQQASVPSCDSNFDGIKNDPQGNVRAQPSAGAWFPPPQPTNSYPAWVSNGSLMQPTAPSMRRHSDANDRKDFQESKEACGDSVMMHMYASLPVPSDRMDHPYSTVRYGYPISDQAHNYYFENIKSLECAYGVNGPPLQYHNYNHPGSNHHRRHDGKSSSNNNSGNHHNHTIGSNDRSRTASGMVMNTQYAYGSSDAECLIDRSIIHAMDKSEYYPFDLMEDGKAPLPPILDNDLDSIGMECYFPPSNDTDIDEDEP
jgi:hypothetical protein